MMIDGKNGGKSHQKSWKLREERAMSEELTAHMYVFLMFSFYQ